MMHRGSYVLAGLLTLAACRKAPAPPQTSSSAAPSASAVSRVARPDRGAPSEADMFRSDDPDEDALLLGPAPDGASADERAQRLKELLSGKIEAARLPLIATDPGAEHDPRLFRRLTTEVEPPSRDPLDAVAPSFKLRVGPTEVLSGNMNAKLLQRAAREMQGGFRLCYQEALADKYSGATPAAKAVAVFDMDPDGRPRRIRPEGATSPLFACIKERGMALALEPAPGALRFRLSVETKAE